MLLQRIARSLCLAGSLALVLVLASARQCDARLLYKKGFETLYKEKLKDGRITCAVCHPSGEEKTKRDLNRYGQALANELGEKDVKDMDKILRALKAIEKR